jgi:hypothetical protein
MLNSYPSQFPSPYRQAIGKDRIEVPSDVRPCKRAEIQSSRTSPTTFQRYDLFPVENMSDSVQEQCHVMVY